MGLSLTFKIGEIIDNTQLSNAFKCGNMGGMRRSHKTNTLVIISDHTKGLYDDKWYEDILHYTGMGKLGDQKLEFMQNKTLNESKENGVEVHLFEVFEQGAYLYRGILELVDNPYQENQKDDDGEIRKVWMFPMQLKTSAAIDKTTLEKYQQNKQKKIKNLPTDKLKQRALDSQCENSSARTVQSKVYVRNEDIAEYTKRIANGQCQLCEKAAPFSDKDGRPYLESHHIVWLSKGGPDTLDNTIALCPNCHKKMHILNDPGDVLKLQNKITARNEM